MGSAALYSPIASYRPARLLRLAATSGCVSPSAVEEISNARRKRGSAAEKLPIQQYIVAKL
jgi:hypothetical protein